MLSGKAAAHPGGSTADKLLRDYVLHPSAQQKARMADALASQRMHKAAGDYLRQMPRRFAPGEVYSPHDLGPVEMQKWRRKSRRKGDVVDALGIRPLDMYKNFSLVKDFTTSSGQIAHSSVTGLRPVNQRRVAKMIRRVQGMGIYPRIHDHPEALKHVFFPKHNDTR
ncbi:hypothetical protein CDD83_2655 [Cordyceps sp. RAO-2017]|nr:hypothetical protein CDD83_2655 [Cordyceps sp. RAO-2017]